MTCLFKGCKKKVIARYMCAMHYGRERYHGNIKLHPTMKRGNVQSWVEEHRGWVKKIACLVWPFATTKGYAVAEIDGRLQYVHRYYCEQLNGPAPEGKPNALHNCGRGSFGCVNPHHTYWGDQVDNALDWIHKRYLKVR